MVDTNREAEARAAAEKILGLCAVAENYDEIKTADIEQIILAAMERDDQGLAEWLYDKIPACREMETKLFNEAMEWSLPNPTVDQAADVFKYNAVNAIAAAIAAYRKSKEGGR